MTGNRSELGLRTDKSFAVPDGILTLRGRLAWAHDFGAAQARDSSLTTTSVEMKWANGWSAAVTIEGEFSAVTRSYAGKGVARYTW